MQKQAAFSEREFGVFGYVPAFLRFAIVRQQARVFVDIDLIDRNAKVVPQAIPKAGRQGRVSKLGDNENGMIYGTGIYGSKLDSFEQALELGNRAGQNVRRERLKGAPPFRRESFRSRKAARTVQVCDAEIGGVNDRQLQAPCQAGSKIHPKRKCFSGAISRGSSRDAE